jgi:hypothetical protein
MGGGQADSGNTITENMSFFAPTQDYGFVNIGQYTPASNLIVTNNVFVGGYVAVAVEGVAGPFVLTGNKIYTRPTAAHEITLGQYANQTPLAGYTWDNNQYFGLNVFFRGTYDGSSESGGSLLSFAQWQANTKFDAHSTFASSAPSGTWIYVRPNKYEPKRANITIYNWGQTPSVTVDLSSVLSVGDSYVIRDAQNFYGPAVVSGTYSGPAISIPMIGLKKAQPEGFAAPAHTAPSMGTFVLQGTSASSPQPSSPAGMGTAVK